MVDTETLVNAWRNPEFRATLNDSELPPNPAGPRLVEMDEGDMSSVFGGHDGPDGHGFITSFSGECQGDGGVNCWDVLWG